VLSWHVEYELPGRIVHIWPVSIETPDPMAEQLRPLLAPGETDRAARFKFEHLKAAFILTRGVLRVLLARYLHSVPRDVQFCYGSKGKPALVSTGGLQFNVSHSGGVALFAFTMDCEIGVDVEAIRPMPDMEAIAKRFFCAEETAELMSLPHWQRDQGFFRCWTRKEAYIKATGEGLSEPLDAFRVTLRPGEPAGMLHLGRDPAAAELWKLHDVRVAPGYAAALAYRDTPRPIKEFSLMNPKQLLDFT